MSNTVGEFVVERLASWGVRRVFAYPGDGINGVILALGKAERRIEFVQALYGRSRALGRS